ncbi:hypothetical protein [Nocardia terpenica]|uniref:Uncharacterized protein n=1 Tax=Nocardia terpenica TaxID=455432 RepID=A0A6G9ZE33_9NOCA|nr:hypothetical protein [Nocardia terpenica]QIS23700.1 hypothetical protein F6W96_40910 [Nocardia terpenica]
MASAFEGLVTAADWVRAYRQCALLAVVSSVRDEEFIEICTDDWTSVLVLPPPVGRAVLESCPPAGPILARPACKQLPAQWMFFTWPDQTPSEEAIIQLAVVGGFLPGPGTSVPLPTTVDPLDTEPGWVRWPSTDLPTLSELLMSVVALPRGLFSGSRVATDTRHLSSGADRSLRAMLSDAEVGARALRRRGGRNA